MNLNLINKRRNNAIYTDGNSYYKIFNKNYKKTDVYLEAFITAMVENTGLNVPSIQEISIIDEQWYFKTDCIEGKTLYSMMLDDLDNAEKYLDKMVEIHTSIHKKRCDKLPFQKEKLADHINFSNLDKNL